MTATMNEYFGNGTATFGLEGNICAQVSAGINPATTGADTVLAVFSLPANSFDQAGRMIEIQASGAFASNTNSKECKIIFAPSTAVVGSTVGSGGTTIADTGAYSTTGAAGWLLQAQVAKYGAAGSNTQVAQETGTIIKTTHGGIGVPVLTTANENSPILIAVTGNAATAATDITLNYFTINAND